MQLNYSDLGPLGESRLLDCFFNLLKDIPIDALRLALSEHNPQMYMDDLGRMKFQSIEDLITVLKIAKTVV